MRIDEKFMDEVGLGAMSDDEKKAFMEHAEEELEVRVGRAVGIKLTNEQIEEFDAMTDLEQAAVWLETNCPDYRKIVEDVYNGFKQEIIAERNTILGVA